MNKEEQIMAAFGHLYNKYVWLNSLKMKNRLEGYKPSEVHCIEYIGKNADSNVTKLAEAFYMTLGAISKLTKKLIAKELIENYQKPGNKKEIYFRLTEQGKVIYRTHESLHREFRERDKAVFEQTTKEQFDGVVSFLERYSDHLDAEAKKSGADIEAK